MALYRTVVVKVVPMSTPRAAEMAKLLENIFRNVNIAPVNELTMLCDRGPEGSGRDAIVKL